MSIATDLQTIASNVPLVYNAGYEAGAAQGGNTEEAYSQGFEAGKQAEHDAFWDSYQNNGDPADYTLAFYGGRWSPTVFKPKHPFNCKAAVNMFQKFYWRSSTQQQLVDFSNVVFDVTALTSANDMFNDACATNITLKFSDKIIGLNRAFSKPGGGSVKGMHLTLLVPNPNCGWTSAFDYHNVERLILLEGTQIGRPIDLHWAIALPHDDLLGLINCLVTTDTARTLTLGSTNLAKLTDAEKAIATEKGWTLA